MNFNNLKIELTNFLEDNGIMISKFIIDTNDFFNRDKV